MSIENSLIYLVSCAVNENIPEKSLIEKMDFNQVYSLAARHMLSAMVAMALESAGYGDERSIRAIGSALRKISTLEIDKNAVLKKLEDAGIWYIPLKGAILKDYYPKLGMREMSDYDILFYASRAKDVRNIMENLGFKTSEFGVQNEDVYHKLPVSNFEMHRSLFGARHGEIICSYYQDIKERLIKDNNRNYGFHFSAEDFYIYMITHEYTHYSSSGTGLRSLLDTYVYLKKFKLDWTYVESEFEKLELSDFEKRNRQLALNLFSGKQLSNDEEKMLNYILNSGTYGTLKNNSDNEIARYGRWGYFMRRITLPYPQMLEEFPILKKIPVLYPAFWLHRLFVRGLFLRRKKFICQLKTILQK